MNRRGRRDYEADAEYIIEDAARRLEALLGELAGEFEPFPFFPGTITQIVEVEPESVRPSDKGFLGVCADGGFYEYEVSMDADGFMSSRKDSLKQVDLTPLQFVNFARQAISELGKLRAAEAAR